MLVATALAAAAFAGCGGSNGGNGAPAEEAAPRGFETFLAAWEQEYTEFHAAYEKRSGACQGGGGPACDRAETTTQKAAERLLGKLEKTDAPGQVFSSSSRLQDGIRAMIAALPTPGPCACGGPASSINDAIIDINSIGGSNLKRLE